MVKSFRGKEINMIALAKKNENKIALGNSRMNSRGDIIGRGGIVVRSREEQLKEYQESVLQQSGTVSMKSEEEVSDLNKKLQQYTNKPQKVMPKKKKEEPKEEIIFDEE